MPKLASIQLCCFLMAGASAHSGQLHDAVIAGDLAAVNQLIENGSDVDDPRSPVGSPLHAAALHGKADIAKRLLAAAADVNARDYLNDETALHHAARGNETALIDLLLESGADINAQSDNDFTPLHTAIILGNSDAALRLIESGADIHAVSYIGLSPLHYAGESGQTDVMAALDSKGARPAEPVDIKPLLRSADVERGRKLFSEKNCKACHWGTRTSLYPGPDLDGVVGRSIGTVDGYSYSAALANSSDFWNYDTLNRLLADPMGFYPGSKMVANFNSTGLAEPQDRADIIAYLRTLSDTPVALP